VRTNVLGADALVRATMAAGARVETVIGISTDKACKPINAGNDQGDGRIFGSEPAPNRHLFTPGG
jgi:hypothetical protein